MFPDTEIGRQLLEKADALSVALGCSRQEALLLMLIGLVANR